MSKFLYHEACDCGSSDGRAVFDDGHSYCFVCDTYVGSGETVEKKPSSISDLPSTGLKARGIDPEICKEYGVRVQYDEGTGEESIYFFPRTKAGVVTGYAARRLPKDFYSVGDVKGCELFGQSIAGDGGKLLIVTEGNEDCLAARQMLRKEGKDYRVVSLPSGANIRSVQDNLEWLEKFDSVIFCLDQDEPGQACVKLASELLSPGRARACSLPVKDANEMLREGRSKEFLQCIWRSQAIKPDGIVGIEEVYEQAIVPPTIGLTWPWASLTQVTYGRRRGEMYGIGAGTGAGKSESFKEIVQHILHVDNLPVGLIFLEEHPAHTAKVIAGKLANKRFHVPDAGWTKDELEEGIEALKGRVFLYNHFGQKDWATIRSKIRYMVVSLGVKDIFLDHLTALVADVPDVNASLGQIMADMAALTQELDFSLYFISHLSTPEGRPHEEGGRVTVSQFRGSRAIGFWSHFLFALERNQQAEDAKEKNRVTFRVLKDRYTGESTGTTFNLFYDKETGRLREAQPLEF